MGLRSSKGVLQETNAMPRKFPFELLIRMTDNFSKDREIGHGRYGVVYKGKLDDEEIAVKKLYNQPGLVDDQFNECIILMGVQHPNIVRLTGYCYETEKKLTEYNGKLVFADVEERALCLEYMEGGSLERHISPEPCKLDWCKCYGIIKGVSEGLRYLHTGSRNHIFHLDLKPANILLDRNNIPKIGDFGISRLGSTQTYVTQKMMGTFGYMPPEYVDKQEITSKFDVFSLGVIILQIIAGRTHSSQRSDLPSGEFIRIAHEHWTKRMQTESSSDASWEVKICIEIALRCVESDRKKRPTIAEIVDKLNKVDTSKSLSTCKIVDLRSEKDSDEQCASSDNCGVTTTVPNEAEELPRKHTTGTTLNKLSQQLVPRQITIWLSLAVVLAAVIVLVLRFDLGPEVKAVSLRTLIWLHRIYLWLIRLAIWLSIVLLGAIVVLVLCFIIVPLVKDISLHTLITRLRHIRLAIWLCVAVVLTAITVLVIRFDVVPEVKAISLGTLIFLLRIFVWIIRWAFWLGVAMLLAATIACVVVKHTLCGMIFFFLLITFLATWVTVAVMLAAISVPALRFVVVPELKADIEDARINSFALFTSGMDSFFEYNISVAISVRNPVQTMSVTYTEPLTSTVLFNEQRLYNDTFISVGQKHPAGKVSVYLLYSIGQVPSHVLGAAAVDEYVKLNATGVFNMEVRMSGEITLGLGERHKLSLSCPLSLRLTPGVIEFRTMYCVPVETGKKYF